MLGHNGAGKTTLAKTLVGLQRPISGTGAVLDLALESVTPRSLMLRGGRYLAQGARSFDGLTVQENRLVLNRLYGFRQPGQGPHVNAVHMRELSLGERKLQTLEMMLAGDAKLLLLDEPTSSLDPEHTAGILEQIRNAQTRGIDVLIIEQAYDQIFALCDKCLVLRGGQMTYFGDTSAIQDPARLAALFL